MKKHLMYMTAATLAALAPAAMAATTPTTTAPIVISANTDYDANSSASHTNADGTTVATDKKSDVEVDSKGHVTKSTKVESTTDPKGMWNEKKMVNKSKVEQTDKGYKQSMTKENMNADGTSTSTDVTKNVKVDANGNVIEDTTTENTVDPKGLMNADKTVVKSHTVNGQAR